MLPELDQIDNATFFPREFTSYDTPKYDYSRNGYTLFKTIIEKYGNIPKLDFNISEIFCINRDIKDYDFDSCNHKRDLFSAPTWFYRQMLEIILKSLIDAHDKEFNTTIFERYNKSAYNKSIKLCCYSQFEEAEEVQEKIRLFKEAIQSHCNYDEIIKYYESNPTHASRRGFCFKSVDIKKFFNNKSESGIIYNDLVYQDMKESLNPKPKSKPKYAKASYLPKAEKPNIKVTFNYPETTSCPAKFLEELNELEVRTIEQIREECMKIRTKVIGDPKKEILLYIKENWGINPILNTDKQKQLKQFLNQKNYKASDEGHISALKRYGIQYEYRYQPKSEEWAPIQIYFDS